MSFFLGHRKSSWQRLKLNLSETNSVLDVATNEFLRNHRITYKQMIILDILSEYEDGLSQKNIKDKMPDSYSDTSRIIARMRKSGLIKVAKNKKDARAFNYSLSKRGKKKWNAINAESNNLKVMYKRLNKREIKQLNNLLIKLRSE